LRLIVKDSADEAANFVAQQMASHLKARPDLVMGLATGETMRPVYARLRKVFRTGEAPSEAFSSFNLDEFIKVPKTHPGNFHAYMRSELFNYIQNAENRCFMPDGMTKDLTAAATAFEGKIKNYGGIDLQLLGIGWNGHIGFNEPGTPLLDGSQQSDLQQLADHP